MKALSIKQPWTWAILFAGKDIENRDWQLPKNFALPQTIAVHASKTTTKNEICSFIDFSDRLIDVKPMIHLLDLNLLPFGAILGTVEILGCVQSCPSDWFVGDYGFLLHNPKPLITPIPCKGALGFWEVPAEIEKQFIFI